MSPEPGVPLLPLPFLLCALAGPDDIAGFHRGPAPGWVAPVAVDVDLPAPEGPARESVQYLLVDDQVRLGESPIQRYSHGAWRLVTQPSLDEMSRLEIDFDPSYSEVVLHTLRVWRDRTWSDRLDDAWVTTIQQETSLWQEMFNGVRTLVLVMPDVRVGDVVEYAYTIRGFNPVFAGHFMDALEMGWSVPAGRRQVRLRWPEGIPLSTRAHGDLPDPVLHRDGAESEATWDLASLPALPGAFDLPPGVDAWPWLQVSDYTSWEDVVRWATPLYAVDTDPAIHALAERVCTGDSPEARARSCVAWVQDEVRYFGVEMGPGSHAPDAPEVVASRRYGDCKDKSLLLVALLAEVGVEAWPALVNTEIQRGITDWFPSPMAFDHVVVQAVVNGTPYWMDPTLTQQGGDLSGLWIPPFGKALPIRDGAVDLVDVPLPARPDGQSSQTETWSVAERDGAVRVTVQTTAEGHRADETRAWLADISEDEIGRQGAERYGRPGRAATPDDSIQVADDRGRNVVRITQSYRVEDAWNPDTGEGTATLDLPDPPVFAVLPLPTERERVLPFALPRGATEVDTVRIAGGARRAVRNVDFHEDNDWFRFDATTTATSAATEITYALRVKSDRVAAADLASYVDAVEAVRSLAGYRLTRTNGSRFAWKGEERKTFLGFLAGLGVGALIPASLLGVAALWVAVRRGRVRVEEGEPDLSEPPQNPE